MLLPLIMSLLLGTSPLQTAAATPSPAEVPSPAAATPSPAAVPSPAALAPTQKAVPTQKAAAPQKAPLLRIDPAFWYAGMVNTQLQLLLYAPDINYTELVGTDTPDVQVTNVVHTASPNYLLVYLDLAGAQPGTVNLYLRRNNKDRKIQYELRQRRADSQLRKSFTPADAIYLLMPDRFADGDPSIDIVKGMRDTNVNRLEPSMRHGGDLAGIRQNLDYIEDLGITALWLTPVLENDMPAHNAHSSYHGYAITDFYRTDPRFGTNDDYRNLITDCHSRDIKVIADFVFNHCGLSHPWCDDVPMTDWFNGTTKSHLRTNYRLTTVLDPYASTIDRDETVNGWFADSMPDLNLRNPHVARYLIQSTIWWLETAGIDGIRMDTYPYVDREAMATWMKELHREYPYLRVVGETWVADPYYTASYQRDPKIKGVPDSHLDCVMDFTLRERISQALAEETDNMFQGLNRIYATLAADYLYSDPQSVLAFLDNHDTNRFLTDPADTTNLLRLKQALTLLLTLPRTPQIYYGTEIMMTGTTRITDGDVRRDFPGGWRMDKQPHAQSPSPQSLSQQAPPQPNCFTPEGRTPQQNEAHAFLRTLLHWRKTSPAITQGATTQFLPVNGIYAYARYTVTNRRLSNAATPQRVLVLLNGTSRPATADLTRYAELFGTAQSARDIITSRTIPLTAPLTLSPRESLILEY